MSLSLEKLDSLIYDGVKSPDDFIRVFKLQSVFQEWNGAAQLANLPLFLKGRALTVFDAIATKTTIAEALAGLVAGCGPNREHYMNEFYARKRKPGESMVAFGAVLHSLILKGMPDLKGDAMYQF